MKRKLITLFLRLLLIMGVTLLCYPYIGFWLSKQNHSYVVQEYDDSLEKMTAEQRAAEWERAQAYNAALSANTLYDPFASGQEEMDQEYRSLLRNEDKEVMSRIMIPKIDVDLPIYHGTSKEVLEKGVGHLEGSALPVGGAGTHGVLTGHTGLNAAKLFTDLTGLVVGDEFYVKTLNQTLAYQIDQITVIEPTDTEALQPVAGRDYVTLITCTPYGINSHRLLVRGGRIDYTPEEIEQRIADTEAIISKETWMLYAGLAFLILLILVVFIIKKIKRK